MIKREKITEKDIPDLLKEAKSIEFEEVHPDVVYMGDLILDKITPDFRKSEYLKDPVENGSDFGDFSSSPLYRSQKVVFGPKTQFDVLYSSTFSPLITLYGEDHMIAKRLLMYSIISNSLKGNFIDAIGHDMRINAQICLSPGAGKHELKKAIKLSAISGVGGDRMIEPTSFHPEQFVGKNSWDRKDKVLLSVPGYLEDDILIIDEGKDLLRKESNETTRKYIRIALDPMGYNEVTKGSVDLPEEHRLRYYPKCVLFSFFQPAMYIDELITEGDLRRGICITYKVDPSTQKHALERKLRDKRTRVTALQRTERWHDFLRALKSKTFNWDISEIDSRVIEYTDKLESYSRFRGPETEAVFGIMRFDCAYQLIRMSLVRAACENRSKATIGDVDKAFTDYKEMWKRFLDFVTQYLPCRFMVEGLKIDIRSRSRIKEAIRWLVEQGAISAEMTTITSRDFIEWLVNDRKWWNSTNGGSGAWSFYKLMSEHGYLETKRSSRGVKVWVRIDRIVVDQIEKEEGSL